MGKKRVQRTSDNLQRGREGGESGRSSWTEIGAEASHLGPDGFKVLEVCFRDDVGSGAVGVKSVALQRETLQRDSDV